MRYNRQRINFTAGADTWFSREYLQGVDGCDLLFCPMSYIWTRINFRYSLPKRKLTEEQKKGGPLVYNQFINTQWIRH